VQRALRKTAKGDASAKELKTNDVLAEEAVISEPVSARLFPVTRENTGKFVILGFDIAKASRLSEENSIA
jgi:hypothetical protein